MHDQQTIVNKLFPNLSAQINMPINKTFYNYLIGTHNNTFQFQSINEEITMSIIDVLAPKTSCGFGDISSKTIKIIKSTLINPVTLIINHMLTTDIFPDKLKIDKIIPLHKKMKKPYLQVTDHFHFCLHFLKYLKRLSLNNYITFCKKNSCCIMHNVDSELITLQNLLL